ncbi:hypothetical protein EMEDMD4_980005 [Sinorhizobium medicae]|uniref:Uncharacterized protein n=1 Tax=Sinorhizobium medicae TaxID=110321 RepID=A0A508X8T8_9HYPH|nr:hypothetical protein EMEDMD4_980005 [Sinorhizobium medicae]
MSGLALYRQLSHKARRRRSAVLFWEVLSQTTVLTSHSKTEKTSPTPDQTQWLNTTNSERIRIGAPVPNSIWHNAETTF